MKVKQYDVTSSNASATQRSSCRVRLLGVILAEIHMGQRSNPLKYIRTRPQAPETLEFKAQLRANGVNEQDIQEILSIPQKGGQSA